MRQPAGWLPATRGPAERILARYDGGGIHLHGNGRHLLEAACRIRSLRRRAGDLPLVVGAPFPDFVEALRRHRLVGGCFYAVTGAPEAAMACRVMEQVRAYRA
ncbi:MAG: hypothetical protein AB1505_18800 [Candidatus Latescibacterota bacterium]